MFGGLNGYSVGNMMRPWYLPPAKAQFGGPRRVKCHSNMFDSRGLAVNSWQGFKVSSEDSFIKRLTAALFVVICGCYRI